MTVLARETGRDAAGRAMRLESVRLEMDVQTYRQLDKAGQDKVLERLTDIHHEDAKVIARLLVEKARLRAKALLPDAVEILFRLDDEDDAEIEVVLGEGARVLWHKDDGDDRTTFDAWQRLGDELDEEVASVLREAQSYAGVSCFPHDLDRDTGYVLRLND